MMKWRTGGINHLETIRHGAPAAVIVGSVFLCFAAVAAAVDYQWLWVVGWHFDSGEEGGG
jgi:hypothetical protein